MRDTKIRWSKSVVLNKGTHWDLFPAPFVLWYWNLFSWVSTRLLGLFSRWCLVQMNIKKTGILSEFRLLNINFLIVWCPNQPRNARFCCLELLSWLFLCVDNLTLKNAGWRRTDLIWRIWWGFAKTLVWNNFRGQWWCLSITTWTRSVGNQEIWIPTKRKRDKFSTSLCLVLPSFNYFLVLILVNSIQPRFHLDFHQVFDPCVKPPCSPGLIQME